ncbi:armadillo repeat-containing protein 2-like [Watersipora subatra]|uniref:armadillo repeat-containing protein 2-like n=1 Tax=Watersipora subatra TaxID=2589382 RepID=UPI00355BF17E
MDPKPPDEPKGKDKGKGRPSQQRPFYEVPRDVITPAQIVSKAKQELEARSNRDKARGVRAQRPFTPRDDDRSLFGGGGASERPSSTVSIDTQLAEDLTFDFDRSRPPSTVSGTAADSGLSGVAGAYSSSYLSSGSYNKLPIDTNPSVGSSSHRPPSTSGTRRPISASTGRVRLEPLQTGDDTMTVTPPKSSRPPSGDVRRRHKVLTKPSPSQSDSTAPLELAAAARSGSCGDLKEASDKMVGGRRVHSGPKERTSTHCSQVSGLVRRDSSGPLEERGEGDGQVSQSREITSAGERSKLKGVDHIDSDVQSLVDILKTPDVTEAVICSTCSKIYEKLDSAHLLGCASTKRSHILKAVVGLLRERSNARVLLSLASLALAVRVSGKHLTAVCKIIFKVSKQGNNDQLFISTNVLELLYDTMTSIEYEHNREALLYCCGVIKNLAGNPSLSETLSRKYTLYTLATILAKVNKLVLDSSNGDEKLTQVLNQLTSALRKFASQTVFVSQFVSHSIIDELCVTSVACSSDYELMLNICSTLGKLTDHTPLCCTALSKHPSCYRSLLKLLTIYTHKKDLVLRIAFVLGNLADQDEECRLALFNEKDSILTLMNVFEHYMQLSLKDTSEVGSGSRKSLNDVLTRLIRVIANLSISEHVGTMLADDRRCVEYLLHILDVKDITEHEELMLTAMVAMNNLSFYNSPATVMEEKEIEASRCLMKLLLKDHKEGLAEVCRIYGNLTRSRRVRDFLAANTVLEIMVTLLDSGDQDLVYFCCGVLVNCMLDEDKRPVLKREGGISKLADVLKDFAMLDWSLAGLVCQVLWNYSTNIRSSNNTFGDADSHKLITLLTDYIDNAHLPPVDGSTEEMRSYLHDTWRMEFCSVAAQLRKRIKSNLSKLVELSAPSSDP